MIRKLKSKWHQLKFMYYHQMARDCLDPKLKENLIQKANYHRSNFSY
ncbi:hypothetical protein SAMN04488137_3479 [Fictibacillus solisalsi]|uniref:Uncharacterized protein n=1 Tax=Fictibacillus solisalsi TaxID=459525 RepID=A0A1G9YIZ3_9BACL|nr:hypothetical protein SAMN04488137_3479 [Fictibacillus solisalsi]